MKQRFVLVFVLVWATLRKEVLTDGIQQPLRVGAWNVQDLGQTKMGKPEVVNAIVKVMRRFDLICIMEIVDKSEEVPSDLLQALNEGLGDEYNFALSERVGSTSAKEQYGCYWRSSRLLKLHDYQFNDTADQFVYDPFGVVVEVPVRNTTLQFGLLAIHTRPSAAETEIDALADVYDDFKNVTGVEDLMIAGDYNAGCSYVTSKEWPHIRLWTESRFTWLISHHIDTTVKDTTCPYDRIVLAGPNLPSLIYANSAQPFYFDEDENFNFTSQDKVEDVSDHYPVEVLLPGEVLDPVSQAVGPPLLTVSVELVTSVADMIALNIALGGDCKEIAQDAVIVTWSTDSLSLAVDSLNTFSTNHPNVVSQEAVSVLQYKVEQGVLQDHTLYGQWKDPEMYKVSLLCKISHGVCSLSITAKTALN